MIVGIGIDLVEISRIRESLEKFGDTFLERIFLPDEIAYGRESKFPERHFAVRFAAKEAVSKAFGTGIGEKLEWKDIEVRRDESGRPSLMLHGKGRDLAEGRDVGACHLSLTHTDTTAAAMVVLESTRE